MGPAIRTSPPARRSIGRPSRFRRFEGARREGSLQPRGSVPEGGALHGRLDEPGGRGGRMHLARAPRRRLGRAGDALADGGRRGAGDGGGLHQLLQAGHGTEEDQVKFPLAAILVAAAFLGIAAASGEHRFGAMVGSAIAGATGLASILAEPLTTGGSKAMQKALAVVVVGFLLRLVLVALGTVMVVRASGSVVAFVVAFFVPFFAFVALEAAYVHTLRRAPETTA